MVGRTAHESSTAGVSVSRPRERLLGTMWQPLSIQIRPARVAAVGKAAPRLATERHGTRRSLSAQIGAPSVHALRFYRREGTPQ